MSRESGPSTNEGYCLAKPLRYLYFRIYTWNLRKFGEDDVPQFNALLGTAFLMLMNLLSIPIVSDQLGILAVSPDRFRNLVIALIPLTFGINYLLLFRGQRYLRIAKEFSAESDRSHRRGTVAIAIYMVGSVGVFFGVALLGAIARS